MPSQTKNNPASGAGVAPTPDASSSSLRLDTSRIYESHVGAEGLGDNTMAANRAALERAHHTLVAKSAGGMAAEFACLNLHNAMLPTLDDIDSEASRLRRYPEVLVLGIGGSSLGAAAVYHAMRAQPLSGSRLTFIENIAPDYLHALLQKLKPEATATVVISKSGGTIETVIQYLIVRAWLEKHLGTEQARQQQWLITDPKQGWLRMVANRDALPALPVPEMVGGRYSVLTAVGLLPLAAAGIDIRALLRGAADNAARSNEVTANPALEIAALYYLLDTQRNKRISIFMPYVDELRLFGDWYGQLWAESLGKQRGDGAPAGTLPVRATGTVDQHSQLQMYLTSRHDKVFTFITLDAWEQHLPIPLSEADRAVFPYLAGKTINEVLAAEFTATRQVVTEYGHPNLTIHLPRLSAHTLGQLIDLYQRATVYAGLLYGINPLDQPAVEKGKQLTIQLLQKQAATSA